jgi:hypothetical protein
MPVQGSLRANTIAMARLEVDFLQNPVKVHAVVGLASSESGQTHAWASGDSNLFSEDTLRKLRELCDAMETDFARKLFGDGEARAETVRAAPAGGLAEHLGEEGDVHSV